MNKQDRLSDGRYPLQDVRILIAEDDTLQANDLSNLVRVLGASVVGPCTTTSQSIQLLKSSSVDFAIVDLKLADCLSLSLMDEIDNRGIPFAIITAYYEHPKASEKRALARFEKPISYEALIDAIKSRLPRCASDHDPTKPERHLDQRNIARNRLMKLCDNVLLDPSRRHFKRTAQAKLLAF